MARPVYGRWNVYFGKTSSAVVTWMYGLAALDLLLTVAKYLEWASSVDPTADSAIVGWMRVNGFRVFGGVELLLLLFLNQVNNGGEQKDRQKATKNVLNEECFKKKSLTLFAGNQCFILFFITIAVRITAYAFIWGEPAAGVWVGNEMFNHYLHLASIIHFAFWGCVQIAAHGEWYRYEYDDRKNEWLPAGFTSSDGERP